MPPKKKTAQKVAAPAAVVGDAGDDAADAAAGLDGDKPAEAAVAEALAPPVDTLTIEFRGLELTIEREILRSARFLVAMASGQDHRILFEIIGLRNVDRFMSVLQRGEQLPAVAAEFLEAVGKAAGWGNSGSSR